jgi:hypothetical protein
MADSLTELLQLLFWGVKDRKNVSTESPSRGLEYNFEKVEDDV